MSILPDPLQGWPREPGELRALQEQLAELRPPPWLPGAGPVLMVACAVVTCRAEPAGGGTVERGIAAAALVEVGDARPLPRAEHAVEGALTAPFAPGLLALREGPLLARAVRALPHRPDVLLVHAAGRDHPRRAGLALMLGAALELPSFGVTTRPLLAAGAPPDEAAGSTAPLVLGGEVVARWVRTRSGVRPLVAHAGWRIDPDRAAALTLAACAGHRTPEPLRRALELARSSRRRGLGSPPR